MDHTRGYAAGRGRHHRNLVEADGPGRPRLCNIHMSMLTSIPLPRFSCTFDDGPQLPGIVVRMQRDYGQDGCLQLVRRR